jgi:hypothetical protein
MSISNIYENNHLHTNLHKENCADRPNVIRGLSSFNWEWKSDGATRLRTLQSQLIEYVVISVFDVCDHKLA